MYVCMYVYKTILSVPGLFLNSKVKKLDAGPVAFSPVWARSKVKGLRSLILRKMQGIVNFKVGLRDKLVC